MVRPDSWGNDEEEGEHIDRIIPKLGDVVKYCDCEVGKCSGEYDKERCVFNFHRKLTRALGNSMSPTVDN